MGGASDEEFGAVLRALRTVAGLSQEELAERAQLSAKAISALERGERRRPYPHTVRALATALDLDDAARARLLAAVPSPARPAAGSPAAEPATASATTVSATASPSPAAGAPDRMLAAPATQLLGRDGDIAVLVRLLGEPSVRLVTVTGPGGVGKTRVALGVAESLRAAGVGEVAVVALAAVSEEHHVWPAVASALSVPATGGVPPLEALAGDLAERDLVLILDNLEHVLGIAPQLAWLLGAAPRLRVLGTSRAALRIRGERDYALPPLSLPRADGSDVAASEAVALFIDRARDVQPDFTVDADNAASVVALCRRLDGLPLAIEIAAAQLRHVDLDVLVARLDRVLGSPGQADLPARQRTLRETLRWSHDRLDAAAQAVYRRVGVFRDGWTLEAAEAVASGPDLSPDDVLPALGALVDQSLVVVDRSGPLRYRMLEPVRQHALERLEDAGEAAAVRSRHARWFADLAFRPGPTPVDARGLERYARLTPEHRNVIAAFELLLDEDPATAAQLAWDMWGIWLARGHRVEGLALAERAVTRAPHPAALCRAAVPAGILAFLEADLARSVTLLEQGLRAAEETGDTWLRGHALSTLGTIASLQDRLDEAEELLAASLAEVEAAGDIGQVALTELARGTLSLRRGDRAQARERFERGAAAALRSGHLPGVDMSLLLLGELASAEGDQEAAEAHLRGALQAAIDVGEPLQIGACAEALALVAARRGRLVRAAQAFGIADRVFAQARGQRYAHLITDAAALRDGRAAVREALGDDACAALASAAAALSDREAFELLLDPSA